MTATNQTRIVLISGGVSDPSSTRLLADRIGAKLLQTTAAPGRTAQIHAIDQEDLASGVAFCGVGVRQG